MEGASVASRVSRRSDNSELKTRKPTRTVIVPMDMESSLTMTHYAKSKTPNLIGEKGHAKAHEVEVRGGMIRIESVFLPKIPGGEETGAGTIGETVMWTAAGGDEAISDDGSE